MFSVVSLESIEPHMSGPSKYSTSLRSCCVMPWRWTSSHQDCVGHGARVRCHRVEQACQSKAGIESVQLWQRNGLMQLVCHRRLGQQQRGWRIVRRAHRCSVVVHRAREQRVSSRTTLSVHVQVYVRRLHSHAFVIILHTCNMDVMSLPSTDIGSSVFGTQ